MSKRWFVVHAYSGFEKKVIASLKERIALAGMQDRFGEILVPTEEVIEMRAGQKRKSERKFFPGYVLVKMMMVNGPSTTRTTSPTSNRTLGLGLSTPSSRRCKI